jgi:Ca2+-binding RTX toxin-like protein
MISTTTKSSALALWSPPGTDPFSSFGLTLNGTKGKDKLTGGQGNDKFYGDYGNDTLKGLSGADTFVFNAKLGSSKTDRKVNYDTITDFSVRDDSIWLDNKIFKKLGKKGSESNPAQLNKKFFKIGDKAKDKDDYVLYDKKTGILSYDADGSGTTYKPIEFAKLSKNLKMTYNDFFVV